MESRHYKEYDTVTISSRRYNEFIEDIEDLKNTVAKTKEEYKAVKADRDQFLYDKQCCFADLKRLDDRIKELESELRRKNGESP